TGGRGLDIAASQVRVGRQFAGATRTGLRSGPRSRSAGRRYLATERAANSGEMTAAALTILLFASLLLLWAPGRWAVAAYQTGVFILAIFWIVRADRFRVSFPL